MKNLVPGARIPMESINEHHEVSERLFQTLPLTHSTSPDTVTKIILCNSDTNNI